MPRKTITTMSRARFDQLVADWEDGALLERWAAAPDPDDLTEEQQLEHNHIMAIAHLIYNDRFLEVESLRWATLTVQEDGTELIVALKGIPKHPQEVLQ